MLSLTTVYAKRASRFEQPVPGHHRRFWKLTVQLKFVKPGPH